MKIRIGNIGSARASAGGGSNILNNGREGSHRNNGNTANYNVGVHHSPLRNLMNRPAQLLLSAKSNSSSNKNRPRELEAGDNMISNNSASNGSRGVMRNCPSEPLQVNNSFWVEPLGNSSSINHQNRSTTASSSPQYSQQKRRAKGEGDGNQNSSSSFPSGNSNRHSDKRSITIPLCLSKSKSNEGIVSSTMADIAKNKRNANVLEWLIEEAPTDLLPRILSFMGSRKIAVLSCTSKRWKEMALSEPVWRTACEDTHKWKDGDPIPVSWLEFYRINPCVPIDYNSIESAFLVASIGKNDSSTNINMDNSQDRRRLSQQSQCNKQHKSIRILLHPGKYTIRNTLVVHTVGSAKIAIETLEVPPATRRMPITIPDTRVVAVAVASSTKKKTPKKQISKKLGVMKRGLLGSCRSFSVTDIDRRIDEPIARANDSIAMANGNEESFDVLVPSPSGVSTPPRKRAQIVFKTRKQDEPIVRVEQGTLSLLKLDLVHNSQGTDIWNGNAAVQIQPPLENEAEENRYPAPPVPPALRPTALLTNVDVKSFSGRGVVAIDGGEAIVNDSLIHKCAATGIYVGGPGSVATINRTDIIYNGNGNEANRRGIARGHSGIYLEQGVTIVNDCNVSNNSLTGLSAISNSNATVRIHDSDLMSNGSLQLEMPPVGSASMRRSSSENNRISSDGAGRSRSGLVKDDNADEGADDGDDDNAINGQQQQPQSPLRAGAVASENYGAIS
mmetsp:Transcript_47954/g.71031  ORF Transcript_47954/g.71031 Transcript_47954/m.71031 type:complete len:730 (+) Transcript_47954:99-2288(+)|eukprot:CAMPEP_0195529620 /NCGR_PEP_ID=MMETSP0794_2-20130614/32235_1 /TAXON_ID=515487 /ORGANISM="Stephanopyxis turris, Strain CCMP 815" /LENGTH=729 /DNA_ID=CAMNT_0040660955 /DNA_START=94 /DNA_END=2283 /DNA_ORIENTATION=+